MCLLLDAESVRRLMSGGAGGIREAIACPYLSLPRAADLRGVLHHTHADARHAPGGPRPVELRHGSVHVHDEVAGFVAHCGPAAEIQVRPVQERSKLADRFRSEFDT